MTIIEQALVAKNPLKRCEDGIVTTPDFVAVIDGSTSKSQLRCHRDFALRPRSNGELAMLSVAASIKKLPANTSCHQFCQIATSAIRSRYKKSMLNHLESHPEDRLTASCIVFSRLRREIWMIGDCQCLVGDNYFDNPKPYEQELAERRAEIISASPKPWDYFLDDDTARAAIIPRMKETMQLQNKAYSVVDGFPVAEEHVRIITLSFKPWQIVLASDGYPFLCPTLAESEARLEAQRQSDPLNIGEFKATKAFARGNNSFDDRAYIRFTA